VHASDPWQAFTSFMEGTCALFARDRAYADIYRSWVPAAPVIAAAQQRLSAIKADIMTRAKNAGVLRADVEPTDIAIVAWSVAGTMDATRDVAPRRLAPAPGTAARRPPPRGGAPSSRPAAHPRPASERDAK
jgi:Transcriptional regulator SbtR-like, C-terminal domain